MIESFLALARLVTIAHRGGAKLRPENTFAAFDHAVALGADLLECDVHLSRDGDVVVIHDSTLDRTTNATGPVAGLTSSELARLDAGFHFGAPAGYPYRGGDLTVPRLRDLLDRYRDWPIVIEVKGDRPNVAERTVEVIREARATERVILSGFSHLVLRAARRLAPELVTSASLAESQSALVRSRFRIPLKRSGFRLFQVPFRLRGRPAFHRSFVRAARRAGVPVQAWVVDDPDDMRRLIAWGVTGIISDRPDIAVAVVSAEGAIIRSS